MDFLRSQPFGAGYTVQQPAFAGPLDLLLQMIEVRELDVSLISLMGVTDQYLKTIHALEEIEPGALADFLVVASRLIYIKSYQLLPKPRPPVEEEEEASGDLLLRQLIDYRRFKAAAAWLRGREASGLRLYVRTVPRPEVVRRLEMAGLDLKALQRGLRQVLQRLPAALPRVKSFPITVAEQIEVVRASLKALLGRAQVIRFEELMGRGTTRLEVVVTFLAVLELVKLHEIEVLQDETFGTIRLMPAAAWGASAAAVPAEAE